MPGELIDTHAHLDFRQFDEDRDAVIERAFASGLAFIVNVGTDASSSQRSIALAERYEKIYATVGYHPHDAEKADDGLDSLRGLVRHPKVIAVGETGLDFYRNYAPREAQVWVFRGHIRLAREVGLPLVVHSRDAYEETMTILEEEGAAETGGVLHCFSGDLEMARRGLGLGFCLAFGGAITFRKSSACEVARRTPVDRILLETDCPYQTPAPCRTRSRRNEPAFVQYVAEQLAEDARSVEEVAQRTSDNARKLFGLR